MQEMGNVAEYITKNFLIFEKLLKVGKVSLTVKQEYEIYQYYQTTKHIKSTMQRYQNTADAMGVSEITVRRAVAEMKKVI